MPEFMDDRLDIIRQQVNELNRKGSWSRKIQVALLANQQALHTAWKYLTPEQQAEVSDAHNAVLVMFEDGVR